MSAGIQRKVLTMVGTLVSCSAVYFVLSTLSSRENVASLRRASEEVFPSLQAADSAIFLSERLKESLNAAVGTKEKDELDNSDHLADEIRAAFRRIDAQNAHDLLALFDKYYVQARDLSATLITGKVDFGSPEVAGGIATMRTNGETFGAALKAFRAQRNDSFTQSIEDAATTTDRVARLGYVLMALSLGLLAVIIQRLRRDIVLPITDLSRVSQEVSAGRFPPLPPARTRDEIGVLSTNFGTMIHDIRTSQETMEQVVLQGRRLSGAVSIPNLTETIREAFQVLARADLSVTVLYSSRCFMDRSQAERFFPVTADGAPDLAAGTTSQALSEQVRAPRRLVWVDDPRTHERLAAVLVDAGDDARLAKALPTLEALAINVANALAAIRLEQAFQLIDSKSRQIRSVFAAISQGICTVDRDLRIGPEYSSHLETILGRQELAGMPFMEVSFERSLLPADLKGSIEFLLRASIGGDRFTFDLNSHVLPREVTRDLGDEKSELEIDWIPICSADDKIVNMMITVRDVTEVRRLREAAEARSQEAAIVDQVLRTDPRRFAAYAANTTSLLATCAGLVQRLGGLDQDELKRLKRDVHTIKGNSRTLGLTVLAQRVHELEDIVFGSGGVEAVTAFASVEALFKKYMDTVDRILHWNTEAVAAADQPKGAAPGAPLGRIAAEVHAGLPELCRQLGRAVPVIDVDDGDCHVDGACQQVLSGVLTHLMRNSIDHGLKGQPNPRITVRARPTGRRGRWQVVYLDSGRGLDLGKLLAMGRSQGRLDADATDLEIANSIFESGVSTAAAVTDVSGRGVGMDAVRAMLTELGGSVWIELFGTRDRDGYRRFALMFEIPAAEAPTALAKAG